jgi:hypothetical protein
VLARPAQRRVVRPALKRVGPDQHRDGNDGRDELAKHLQPLGSQHSSDEAHARDIATGSVEAVDEPVHDGIAAGHEYDRHRRGGSFGCERSIDVRDDDCHRQADQFADETRQALGLIVGVAVFDRDVLTFG